MLPQHRLLTVLHQIIVGTAEVVIAKEAAISRQR